MAKKHISVTNEEVLRALEQQQNASRFIEEAILYYLNNIDHDYITRDEVSGMIMDALKNVQIKNPNYSSKDLTSDIKKILDL